MSLPYGSWPSPFTAASIEQSEPRFDGARFVGDDMWWGETVPDEGGRATVRSQQQGVLLAAPWNVRSRVHEYGGGAWTATDDGTLFFVEASDQRIYRVDPGGVPEALTEPGPSHGGLRVQGNRLFAIREDLSGARHLRAVIALALTGGTPTVFAESSNFYAHPALSPSGTQLAWVEWDERALPWDAAGIEVLDFATGQRRSIPTRAALQPEWVTDDTLLYLDDASGRWAVYRCVLGSAPTQLSHTDADTGYGLWVLGNRWYQPLDDGRAVVTLTNGADEVAVLDPEGGLRPLAVPASGHVSVEDAAGARVLLLGNATRASAGVWCVDADSGEVTAVAGGAPTDPAWMPPARAIEIDGVPCFLYPPCNPLHEAPDDELPPYVVLVHGGPTAHVTGAASASIAYFTSRGIGVLDVNYAGSTGYGRDFRERLGGAWGVADVDDVITAAQGLVNAGLADPQRLAIRGGSAGGWTVLCALVRGGAFTAGISRYGVADLRMLAADTHDFEKYYLDGLVGPLPEAEQLYIDRSPLSHSDKISVPVLLLQGSDDRVVPPSQSLAIRDALSARGVEQEYIEFEGEGHGFRRTENRIAALEAELRFLGRVFGFTPELG